MKIAFTFLTYGKDIFGGIENALFNLTKGLDELDHDVFVFTSSTYIDGTENFPADVYRSKFLPTEYNGNVKHLISSLYDNRTAINNDFDYFLEKFKPDHVVVVDPIWGILGATYYTNNTNTPFSISYHIANTWAETRTIMAYSLLSDYVNFFVVSTFLSTEIKKEFPKAKNIAMKVLPNSIDTSLYESNITVPEQYILCNSRIAEGKNVDVLVEAFSTIKNDGMKLVLCTGKFPFGDSNSERSNMERLVKKLGIENRVEFLPNLEWRDVPELVKKSYAVVLPSTYETFGIAALEASIAGVPLIAAYATNFKDLVKKNALYFSPNDVTDLGKKIRDVIDNYEHYKKKSGRCKAYFVNRYNNKIVAERLLNAIRSDNMQ
ncbi:glycosyltransferase family 4 protein [Patescibacteria group bacterium]|nr:glycosyltransferase family 4 protein [Patescibacteria group bacterium]